jgi:hypothetical protein
VVGDQRGKLPVQESDFQSRVANSDNQLPFLNHAAPQGGMRIASAKPTPARSIRQYRKV